MTFKFYDRVQVSVSSAPGTGAVALGSPVTAFQSFAQAGASNGDTFSYLIVDGASWEFGVGTYNSAGPTISRTTMTASSSGSAISFTANAIVMATLRGEDMGSTLAGDTDVSLTSPANHDLLTYITAGTKWENNTLTALLDSLFSSTQGSVLYRGASSWSALAPGSSGQVLTTGGSGANPAWATPSAGGAGPGGTRPTVVQFDYAQVNGAFTSITMGAAPANGNLLVCVVFSAANITAGTGWTSINYESSGQWYMYILTKTAGASESVTQTPFTGTSTQQWTAGIWEVNGQHSTSPIITADAKYVGVWDYVATPIFPAPVNTLCLMAMISAANATTGLSVVAGAQTVNLNNSGGAGARAAYGWSDSTSPFYAFWGACTANSYTDSAMIIITS